VAKLPFNLSKALDAWREASARTTEPAGITLAGDPRLVTLAQEQFSSGGIVPATWVGSVTQLAGPAKAAGETMIVFTTAAQEAEVRAALLQIKAAGVLVVDEGPEATGATAYLGQGCTRVSFSDTPSGWQRVFEASARAAGPHAVALGRRYPVLREATARQVVHRAAGQNALIGLAFFIPGTDMPAMTLNQMKMILSIASIYGEEIDRERALELAGVVGMGFGFRALSRSLTRSIPGIGWVVKAVTGYSGTLAMGMGAIRYFENGAPASTGRVVALAGSLKR
jgi:uncharacterized protein (DUF697 family)